ncbi:hypothetical protein MBLNU457_5047t1 [Dothideomycetes sp. NU457]
MNSGRKRKADADDTPASASKRQRFAPETSEATTEAGLQLIQALKNAKDKTGREISTLFLTLPDERDLPEYYATIKLPIAIATVEEKLRRSEYANLTQVESDVKRMVANAKQFNDDKSIVFGDAERVRKLLSNWMKVHNPAYLDPEYTAFPTPIPGEDDPNGTSSATPARGATERPKKPTINLGRARKPSPLPEPEEPEQMDPMTEAGDFTGKTFGEAQQLIIQELIDYVDDEGLLIFDPFRNLPTRALVDYYQVIKHPVSLSGVKKRTIGKHGREAATGITDFKSWDAFEQEVSFIWKNARTYNEDGSDMYNLAGEFEEHFKSRLAAAKAAVEEPSGPRLKLNARPRPTLHLGAKGSPAPSSTLGVSTDSGALARQKQTTSVGPNGQQTPQATPSQGPVAADVKQSEAPEIKTEVVAASPALNTARPASVVPDVKQASVPPISMPPPSAVPASTYVPQPVASTVPTYNPAPVTFMDNFSRTKPVSEALLSNLQISTHPQLNAPKPFSLDIPPSPDFTNQSLTVMLPASQYYLQLKPTVSNALSSGRQYKLFVMINGQRVNASKKPVMNGDVGSTAERKSVYDISLSPGVNRIEVEIAAVTGRGGTLEIEKLNVLVNLMRN